MSPRPLVAFMLAWLPLGAFIKPPPVGVAAGFLESQTMNKILFLLAFSLFDNVYADSYSCFPRAELGESKGGGNIYDRNDESNISYMSKFDFEKLTLTDTNGRVSKIAKLENNLYTSSSDGKTWYFVVSNDKTIVSETSIDNLAIYVKVLFCK